MPLLSDLIDLPTGSLIAIVGAGGKTATMYTLASELAQRGKRVITTTTTQIFYPEPGETDTLIVASETDRLLKKIDAAWQQYHRVTVAGAVLRTEKLTGLHPEHLGAHPERLTFVRAGDGEAIQPADATAVVEGILGLHAEERAVNMTTANVILFTSPPSLKLRVSMRGRRDNASSLAPSPQTRAA